MQTRTYRGKEISSILNKIRKDHGEEAVILSTKEVERNLIEVQVQVPALVRAQQAEMLTALTAPASADTLHWPAQQISQKLPRLWQLLNAQGVSADIAEFICQNAQNIGANKDYTTETLADSLAKLLSIDTKFPFSKKFVAFIGATGVGKTTTIAKIAARMRIAFDMKIALISADSYRVGAGYQLQTYATLMNLPFRSLEGSEDAAKELSKAIKTFKDFDLVLIDAAGFSPHQKDRLEELARMFNANPEVERILLLPAPSNTLDLTASVKKFAQVGYERTIITKVDESGFVGPVINALKVSGKTLAFLTNGQRVPEDIEPASHKRLAWLLQRTLH